MVHLDRPHERRVQGSQQRLLAMWCGRRDGEPLGVVGQYHRLPKVELRVVAQIGRSERGGVAVPMNHELAAMQLSRALARSVGDLDDEFRCVIVEHRLYQRRPWLRAGTDVVGKVATTIFTGGGVFPPDHAASVPKRLVLTERLTPRGARFLICLN